MLRLFDLKFALGIMRKSLYNSVMTMVRVRRIACWLVCMAVATGCGGGGGGAAPVQAPAPKASPKIISFANSGAAGSDRSIEQYAVVQFADEASSTVFYGTRFLNGTCKSVSQSITQFLPSNLRVRTFYDLYRRPVLLFDEFSLKSIVIQYETSGATLFVLDKDRALAHALQTDNSTGTWVTASIATQSQLQQLYEASGTFTSLTASKPGRYDYQSFYIRAISRTPWNVDSRERDSVGSILPSDHDEHSRAPASSIGVPTWAFLKSILEPPIAKTASPVIDEITLGQTLGDARSPLVNTIRSAQGLTQEEMLRFSQGTMAYGVMESYSSAYMKNNQGASIEEELPDRPLWKAIGAKELGSFYTYALAGECQLLTIVEPDGATQDITTISSGDKLFVPGFTGGYNASANAYVGTQAIADTTVNVLAKSRSFDPINTTFTPLLNRGKVAYLVFDLRAVPNPITLKTDSAPGSSSYVAEDQDRLIDVPYLNFKYSDWRRNPTQGLSGRAPFRALIWKRYTTSGTQVLGTVVPQ